MSFATITAPRFAGTADDGDRAGVSLFFVRDTIRWRMSANTRGDGLIHNKMRGTIKMKALNAIPKPQTQSQRCAASMGSDEPLPTRIVKSGWRSCWQGPEPRGHVCEGKLVYGAGEFGPLLHGATIWRELSTGEYKIAIPGVLKPLQCALPPIFETETSTRPIRKA